MTSPCSHVPVCSCTQTHTLVCYGFYFLPIQFPLSLFFFFLNDPAPPEISPLPLHDALPISKSGPADAEGGFWSFWSRLGSETRSELRSLVVVRQVNPPAPPLLPPTQAYFLRENLRLRLLNARLSLLMRDEAGYREDMRAAQAWVRRYFDTRSKQTADALAQLKTLSSASLSFEMPSISESLGAVRGFKSRRERAPG